MSINSFQIGLRGTGKQGFKWIVVVLICQIVSAQLDLGNDTDKPCYHVINDDTGIFNSTSWTITKNWNCTWLFNVSELFVQVVEYDTYSDDVMTFLTSNNDTITTLSGKTDTTFIAYMGTNTSSSIHFQASDKKLMESNRRFKLRYYKGCNLTISSQTGYFRSPRYYAEENAVKCDYNLTVDDNGVPAVTFMDIQLGNDTVVGFSNKKRVGKCNEFSKHCQDMFGIDNKLVLATSLSGNNSHFTGIFMKSGLACTGSQTIKKTGDKGKVKVSLDNTFQTTSVLCRNLVHGPPGHSLQISFAGINISSEYDVLEIHDGDSRQDPLLWRYRRGMDTDGSVVLTSGPAAWIQFSKDETKSQPSYSITFQSLKYGGGMFNEGHITFPKKSADNELVKVQVEDAHYQLSVIPGEQVVLSISEFDLKKTTGYFACYEGFDIDPDQLIKRYSVNMKGELFTNSHRMLLVIHGELTKLVFKASFKIKTLTKMLYSRGDRGQFYAGADDGKWVILKPQTGFIAMTLNLNLPGPAYMNVTDGQTLITMNSTGRKGLPVVYFNHDVTLYYSPDVLVEGNSSISCHYDVIQAVNVKVTDAHGHIASPYYPNQYPYNAKSDWTFTVPAKQALYMAFKNFDLDTNHTLTLRDVSTKKILGNYSGDVVPNDVILPNNVTVEFSSKSSVPVVAQGFEALYGISPCNQKFNVTNNAMHTTGFPKLVKKSTCCVWIIDLPAHPTKPADSVNIISFTYEIKGLINASSTVQFRDGPSMSSLNFTVNLTEGISGTILSRSNQLWIHYIYETSKKIGHGYAFQLNYTTHTCSKDKLCDNGICMHKDWICDGHDNCGDGSDERNCTEPAKNTGVTMTTLALAIVFTFIGTVILTVFCPMIYRRLRRRNPPYDSLQEVMSPSDD